MTLAEAEKLFGVSADILKKFVSSGFIKPSASNCGAMEYREKDFERLGLVSILKNAGFSTEEIKKYLDLEDDTGTDAEQIRMIRKQRRCLLDAIHEKQKTLDQLDFIVWEKKK